MCVLFHAVKLLKLANTADLFICNHMGEMHCESYVTTVK